MELCYDIFGVLSILELPNWLILVTAVSKGAKKSREIAKTLEKTAHKLAFDDVRKPNVSRDTQQVSLSFGFNENLILNTVGGGYYGTEDYETVVP